jgi:hypothetical protein
MFGYTVRRWVDLSLPTLPGPPSEYLCLWEEKQISRQLALDDLSILLRIR